MTTWANVVVNNVKKFQIPTFIVPQPPCDMIRPFVPRKRENPGFSASERRMLAYAILRILRDARGRKILLILVILGAIALGFWFWNEHQKRSRVTPPPEAPSTLPIKGHVRIATWNLRKFSDRDKAGQHPPDLVTIAKIVKEARFDLLAIQEVQLGGAQTVQKLRMQLNEPWRHAITEPTGNHERYGFVYREDRIQLLEPPALYDGPEAAVFDRVPAIAKFRAGNFDFILLTAHLWYGDKANNPRRKAEAAALVRIAQSLAQGPEKDVIVLGDFNEMRASGNLKLFEAAGFTRLNTEPTNLGSTEVFDNILIDPRCTREYAGVSGVVKFDETILANDDKRAMEEISDHRPVWAEFDVAGADDD